MTSSPSTENRDSFCEDRVFYNASSDHAAILVIEDTHGLSNLLNKKSGLAGVPVAHLDLTGDLFIC